MQRPRAIARGARSESAAYLNLPPILLPYGKSIKRTARSAEAAAPSAAASSTAAGEAAATAA